MSRAGAKRLLPFSCSVVDSWTSGGKLFGFETDFSSWRGVGRTGTLELSDLFCPRLLKRRSKVVLTQFSLMHGGLNCVSVRNGSLAEVLFDGLNLFRGGLHHLVVMFYAGLQYALLSIMEDAFDPRRRFAAPVTLNRVYLATELKAPGHHVVFPTTVEKDSVVVCP